MRIEHGKKTIKTIIFEQIMLNGSSFVEIKIHLYLIRKLLFCYIGNCTYLLQDYNDFPFCNKDIIHILRIHKRRPLLNYMHYNF